MRVLVADDQEKISKHLQQGLAAEGYAVDIANDGEEALWLARHHTYDVMLIDVLMPGKDGVRVVRELRRQGIATPIILLTGAGDVSDRIAGLDAGADDYIIKPVTLGEIAARVRAQLRRQRPQLNNVLRIGDLELDLLSRRAQRAGRGIELTSREFSILEILMTRSPRPVSKAQLTEHVWNQTFDSETNVLNVHVKHLRDKLNIHGLPPLLHTVRNVGFVIQTPETKS